MLIYIFGIGFHYINHCTPRQPIRHNFFKSRTHIIYVAKGKKVSLKIEQDINDTNSLTFGYDYSKYEGMSPNVFGLNVLDKDTKNLYARYDWIDSDDNAGYLSYHHNEYNYFKEENEFKENKSIDILSINNKDKEEGFVNILHYIPEIGKLGDIDWDLYGKE